MITPRADNGRHWHTRGGSESLLSTPKINSGRASRGDTLSLSRGQRPLRPHRKIKVKVKVKTLRYNLGKPRRGHNGSSKTVL